MEAFRRRRRAGAARTTAKATDPNRACASGDQDLAGEPGRGAIGEPGRGAVGEPSRERRRACAAAARDASAVLPASSSTTG
ncbi:hypothetical protein [Actinoplanes sp. NPDC051411]|uniref:hypothetical protein n=1 Tax=Actinoplanes sp. NPDC051411 TaxID=3155522 RepID=UPI00344779DA